MRSPFTSNEMTLVKEKKNLIFRKEEFTYTHHSYFCEVSKESFTDTELDTLNLTQVYNQYLDKYNLPFPEEIISIRKKYNLPANKTNTNAEVIVLDKIQDGYLALYGASGTSISRCHLFNLFLIII